MLTPAQITAAADLLAVSKLALQVQDASHEDAKDTNAKFETSLAAQDATAARTAVALERSAAAAEKTASLALNKKTGALERSLRDAPEGAPGAGGYHLGHRRRRHQGRRGGCRHDDGRGVPDRQGADAGA